MNRFRWYRKLLGGIWFFNMYVDIFEETHYSKWEREKPDCLFDQYNYTIKKEVYYK